MRSKAQSGLSCEIASDLCPNPFSHDWHVQPSCQRPNRFPPKRYEFSPTESSHQACARPNNRGGCPYLNPAVLETFQTYRAHKNPVNANIPQNFHQISTWKAHSGRRTKGAGFRPCLIARSSMVFRSEKPLNSAHAEAEDKKLRKDLKFWRSLP